jgi:hypothetical protein
MSWNWNATHFLPLEELGLPGFENIANLDAVERALPMPTSTLATCVRSGANLP